jgi:DNA-binding transcriptional regulator GbsR (MarR family)
MEKKAIVELIQILNDEVLHLEDRIIDIKEQIKRMKSKNPKYKLLTKNVFGYQYRIYEVFKLIKRFEKFK